MFAITNINVPNGKHICSHAKLLLRIKQNKPHQTYETDAIVMEHEHHILRIPVLLGELNPTDLIEWYVT